MYAKLISMKMKRVDIKIIAVNITQLFCGSPRVRGKINDIYLCSPLHTLAALLMKNTIRLETNVAAGGPRNAAWLMETSSRISFHPKIEIYCAR